MHFFNFLKWNQKGNLLRVGSMFNVFNDFGLSHSTREYFEKLALQKKAKQPTLNVSISKTKTNSE